MPQRHPLAMYRRLDHHAGVAEDGPLTDVRDLDADLLEPVVPIPARTVMQQGVPLQIARLPQWASAGQQQGRTDRQQELGVQLVATQTGPVPPAIVNGDIDVIAERPLVHVDRLDPHIDLRVAFAKAHQTRHQPLNGETRLQSHRQRALGTTGHQLVGGIDDCREDVLDIQKVALPLLRQQQGAVATTEQLDPQELLQPLDLVTDGGLSHEQLFGGTSKAQMASGRFKGLQGIERWKTTGHGIFA